MSHLGQTEKSGRATGKSALPSRTDIVSPACQVRKVPQPDLGSFSGVDEGLCRLKAIIMSGGPRDGPATGGVPFCSQPVFPLHGGERACRDRWGKKSVKAPSPKPTPGRPVRS
jgi:hypothetical protein